MQPPNTHSFSRTLQTVIRDPLKALSMARRKFSKPRMPENTSFCYVREDGELTTVIYLYNYWSENYKIERPTISFTLIQADGKELGTHSVQLEPNGSLAYPVATLLTQLSIPTPFEGSVLAKVSDPKLLEGRPLQMNVDYFFDHGKKVSGVHSQWGTITAPKREILASFHVEITPQNETHVVFRNTLTSKGGNANPISIELINHRGERKKQTLERIPPMGMRRVNVKELFAGSESFLEGKPGNLEVISHTEMGRCLFFHTSPQMRNYSFNHATQNLLANGSGTYTSDEMKLMGIGPVSAGPIRVNGEWDTYLIPFVDFFEDVKEYALDLSVYDSKGEKRFTKEKIIRMNPGTVHAIRFSSILKEAGIPIPFEGSFRMAFHQEESLTKYPRGFHYIAGYESPAHHTEFQFDSALFNMPTHNLSNEYQTTKVFSRILVNDAFQTSVFLVNASGEHGYSKTSATQLYAFNPEGTQVGETSITIPPNGCVHLALEEVFPSLKEELKKWNGNGTFKVRDRTTRISGFHFILDRDGTFLCSDHLFGG